MAQLRQCKREKRQAGWVVVGMVYLSPGLATPVGSEMRSGGRVGGGGGREAPASSLKLS